MCVPADEEAQWELFDKAQIQGIGLKDEGRGGSYIYYQRLVWTLLVEWSITKGLQYN